MPYSLNTSSGYEFVWLGVDDFCSDFSATEHRCIHQHTALRFLGYNYNKRFCVRGQDIIQLKCKRLIINDLRTAAGRGGVSAWK
jgi:hypothetical protein